MSPIGSLADLDVSTYAPDDLLVGGFPLLAEKVTIVTGQNLVRGTLLGRIAGAAAAAVADAGNTGDGVFGAVTVGAGVKEGIYRIVCIEPAANAGKFEVLDPDGVNVGIATVGVAFVGPINFTIADGATDFIAGDGFSVTVAAGTKYNKSASAAADGSHIPRAVLAEDCDATAADTEAMAYVMAGVNENALTYGTGHTAASVKMALRAIGIHLIDVQGA